MKLSTRLTRAGASFLIFGLVAAAVPNSGMNAAGACGSSHNDAGTVAAVAVGAGALWFLVGDKKKQSDDNTPAETTGDWNQLHSFIYNGEAQ